VGADTGHFAVRSVAHRAGKASKSVAVKGNGYGAPGDNWRAAGSSVLLVYAALIIPAVIAYEVGQSMSFLEGRQCTETLWEEYKTRGEEVYKYSAHGEAEQNHMAVDRLCSARPSPSRAAVGGSHAVGRTVRRPF